MWVWREPKGGGKGEGTSRREGHPLFRRRDGEREEENQRGKAKRRRDEKMQGAKCHENRFGGDQSEEGETKDFGRTQFQRLKRCEEEVKRREKILGESQ